MQNFLICGNPSCRFVLDLRGAAKPLRRTRTVLNACPECGSAWLATCPFCVRPLNVTWSGHRSHCAHCHRRFHAQAA